MPEYDDERPDFDAAFRDDPEPERTSRRRASRGEAADESLEPPDSASTGEVSRSRLTGEQPAGDDLDFGDGSGDPAPRRRGRGSSSSRSRSSSRSSSGSRSSGSGSRSRSGSGGRGGGRGGASGGAAILQAPRARLALVLAFAVILVVVIALVVKDCQRSQLEDSYTTYINGVAQIQTASAEQGAQLRQVMSNPRGDKPPQLKAKIQAIAKDAQGLVDQADDLDPPGALTMPQRSLVAALEYRVTGLSTLAANLPTLLQSNDEQTKAAGIARPMQRFLASDVIYEDSFKGPATQALEKDDITGIEVPALAPFLPNASFASPDGAKSLISDLSRRTSTTADGGSSTGNLRGMSLESTVAMPSETRLVPGQVATVQSTELLKWNVTVKNGGDFDEQKVLVKASFSYPATPNDVDSREVEIPTIASGATTSIEIPGPASDKVVFGDQGTLVIEIVPVTGETRTDNNSAEYPVKITI